MNCWIARNLHDVNTASRAVDDQQLLRCLRSQETFPLSFTPGLKPTSFTNPTTVVLLLPPGLPPRTIA